MRLYRPAATMILLGMVGGIAAQEEGDIAEEIRRVRNELMQVQDERARVSREKQKDTDDFREYRIRAGERLDGVRAETDSLRALIALAANRNDSLQALIEAAKDHRRGFELLQSDFGKDISAGCERAIAAASLLPPLIAEKHLSALKLLKSETAGTGTDNIEAVARLTQILRDMNDAGGTIQIVQENSSPIAEIRGTAYRLRIGSFFEAVVNAKGTQAAVWTGYDDNGTPLWSVVDDPTVADRILQAVNVREGKSLPQLVQIPLSHVQLQEGE